MNKRPPRSSRTPAPARGAAVGPRAASPGVGWRNTALVLLTVWTLAIGWIALVQHKTPFYSVESDTLGEYIPAARDLRHGVLAPVHYQTKGPGYPLLLAAAGAIAGDDYLAARVVNVAAAAAGAALTWLLFRAVLGGGAALFVMAGLLLNPIYARLAIEAGSDLPTFALQIAATSLVIRATRRRVVLAAGLLAGLAMVTRYNSVFLVPAALWVLLRRPRGPATAALYLIAAAAPVALWWIVAQRAGIALLGAGDSWLGRGIAYEIYGRATTPEAFAASAGRSFHTFLDVVRYQPAVFAGRIASNLATRWVTDLHVLLPWWLGVLAVPGMILGWWRRPGASGLAAHALCCYLTLAAIFYVARFELFLIPFYLSGVVLLMLRVAWPLRSVTTPAPPLHRVRATVLALLLLSSAVPAAGDIRRSLDTAPHETRFGGEALNRLAGPGDRVMARKPNVAYFAGTGYVPLPDADVLDYPGLLHYAHATGARFLFFSLAEKASRPQFALLASAGVNLPGLTQVDFWRLDPRRYCALYEFAPAPPGDAALMDSVVAVLRGIATRQPRLAWVHQQLGMHLEGLGRFREALAELAIAQALAPRDPTTARLQIEALESLGEFDAEAQACERAIGLGESNGVEYAALGWARIQQGRWSEAVTALTEALRVDPGNAEYRYRRALALLGAGNGTAGRRDLESVLSVKPEHAPSRLLLARLLRSAGHAAEALAALEPARPADSLQSRRLRALRDSLRAEVGPSGR